MDEKPFWKIKTLEAMSQSEWESLCDGCARCCMVKLEDEDDGQIHLTRLSCRLLNVRTCRCSQYANRFEVVSDCLSIDVERARTLSWLPATCAYRRLSEGRDLAWWHPLVSGTSETVHQAGISVRGFAMNEKRVKEENYSRYIVPGFDESEDDVA